MGLRKWIQSKENRIKITTTSDGLDILIPGNQGNINNNKEDSSPNRAKGKPDPKPNGNKQGGNKTSWVDKGRKKFEEEPSNIPPSGDPQEPETPAPLTPAALQARLAEKSLLEQSLSGVVGGKTGLLMFLDLLLNSAGDGNVGTFQSYTQAYALKHGRLKELLTQYEQLRALPPSDPPPGKSNKFWHDRKDSTSSETETTDGTRGEAETRENTRGEAETREERLRRLIAQPTKDLPLYKFLMDVGDGLGPFQPPAQISRKQLSAWRADILPRFEELPNGREP